MKRHVSLVAALLCVSTPALANNSGVENALRSRPDLSTFYMAMMNTGVANELEEGRAYTVFAPTNAAFAQYTPDRYPCMYAPECRAAVAMIVRNHIVPGEVYVSDATHERGGLYTIDNRFVTIGEPTRNNYAIDGHNVTYMSWYGRGLLYKIDGVIATPAEMAALQTPAEYAEMVVPQEEVVTRTVHRNIPGANCGPAGCPESRTTTVTRTVTPLLAPSNW